MVIKVILNMSHTIYIIYHEYAPVVTEAKWDRYEIYNLVLFTSGFTNSFLSLGGSPFPQIDGRKIAN